MEKLILEELHKISDKVSKIREDVATIGTHQRDMDKTLTRIEDQTVKTNGRVSVLESFKVKIVAYATVISIIFTGIFQIMK